MPERLPLGLRLYQLASHAAAPAVRGLIARRVKTGKENPARYPERRGEPSKPRPTGPLIWVHGASVGEMLAAVPLIEQLRARQFAVLVTSGTVTSAALAEGRLPPGTLHQFIPFDAPRYVDRFLEHWRPDLALFVESDLWPNILLGAGARRVPIIVINGRLSERSFKRWRLVPSVISTLLSRLDLCLTQSSVDAQRYGDLGAARVRVTGNLKLDAPPPPVDEAALTRFHTLIGLREIIVAASTHAGEEAAMIAAHTRLRAKNPSLLTVIVPRHPARGEGIAALAKAAGLAVAQRSRGEQPKREIDVYVADTVGEMGLIYRIAPIVFMGGSLASHGGQNPIEAIRLGAAVLHGPHVWNFADIYTALDKAHGAAPVVDEAMLTDRLGEWLSNPAARKAVAEAGAAAVKQLGGALERTLAALDPYLIQLSLEQRAS